MTTNFRCVDVFTIAPCGGVLVTSFCTVQAATKFLREDKIERYKVTVGQTIVDSRGWR